MVALRCFSQGKTRRLVKKYSWSPVADLLAIVFENQELVLYRLWEEAIGLLTDCDDLICWSPQGSSIASISSKSGSGRICEIESEQVSSASYAPDITHLSWTKFTAVSPFSGLERHGLTILSIGTRSGYVHLYLDGSILIRSIQIASVIIFDF